MRYWDLPNVGWRKVSNRHGHHGHHIRLYPGGRGPISDE